MAGVAQPNWVQRGWKVWVVPEGTSTIDVYTSKLHSWDIDVPNTGIQAMTRYYTDTDDNRQWKEHISGQDLYTDEDVYKDIVASGTDLVKIGVDEGQLFHDARDYIIANMNTIDNSIDSYTDSRRKQQGFALFRDGDAGLEIYDSDTFTFAEIPNDKIVHMVRKQKIGGRNYTEELPRQTYYLEKESDEAYAILTYPNVKGGTIVSDTLFRSIIDVRQADTEVF